MFESIGFYYLNQQYQLLSILFFSFFSLIYSTIILFLTDVIPFSFLTTMIITLFAYFFNFFIYLHFHFFTFSLFHFFTFSLFHFLSFSLSLLVSYSSLLFFFSCLLDIFTLLSAILIPFLWFPKQQGS